MFEQQIHINTENITEILFSLITPNNNDKQPIISLPSKNKN